MPFSRTTEQSRKALREASRTAESALKESRSTAADVMQAVSGRIRGAGHAVDERGSAVADRIEDASGRLRGRSRMRPRTAFAGMTLVMLIVAGLIAVVFVRQMLAEDEDELDDFPPFS
jgi:hypothetical protein